MSSMLLRVVANPEGLDAEEREDQAASLGRRLRELDVDVMAAEPGAPPPAESKGMGGALAVGLAFTVNVTGGALAAVLEAIRSWVAAVASRSVVVELDGDRLEITGANREQIDRALAAFLARHGDQRE